MKDKSKLDKKIRSGKATRREIMQAIREIPSKRRNKND